VTTTKPTTRRATRRTLPRVTDEQRAQIIADKIETRGRIDQLNRSLSKLYRRLDYLVELVPDE
jgi:hypothetical protein